MAIQRITPDDQEVFTLVTNPPRYFVSSSIQGVVSGSLYLFAQRSSVEKDFSSLYTLSQSFHDTDLEVIQKNIELSHASNKFDLVSTYMSVINQKEQSLRKQKQFQITRETPGFSFDNITLQKSNVINSLMPFYRTVHQDYHFGFSNYHSLNFLTSSNLPSETCLIYPDPSGSYNISGSFTFDFWINPRYTTDFEGAAFKAGTLFHRSSAYAVSLITGSQKDITGKPEGFRLILQLSHSAGLAPSTITTGGFPNDLVFLSDDNSLLKNTWNHVSIRWGTANYNLGSGSFNINGQTKGSFVIPSASLDSITTNSCLFIGNFFQGSSQESFFTEAVSERDGLLQLSSGSTEAPVTYSFAHPFNAEVHDLKIYRRYLTNDEVTSLQTQGPTSGSSLMNEDLLFYLPPFYSPESPTRSFYDTHGGVMASPFYERDGSTAAPINVDVSFGGGGHYLNLENYTRDFAQSRYPRLFLLTASVITTATVPTTFNDFLYSSGSNVKRNLTVLPNDNGLFFPNYFFMIPNAASSGSVKWKVSSSQFINDLGNLTPGWVTLRNLIPSASFSTALQSLTGSAVTQSIVTQMFGVSPEDLTASPNTQYTIFQRTGDASSNQVVFFNISNLYYGLQIEPGTLVLKDTSLSGSFGKVEMTLKDDGEGNIYRASHSGSAPDWCSVGNVFYNEGIVVLKHPSLYFFGKDQVEIGFKGRQATHVQTFNLFKRPQMVTSSSNPNYLPVSASTEANDNDQKFVYITGINLHDENLNVVMKTSLAQPVVARTAEKFLFRVKMDY